MIRVVVGSNNPVKVQAARAGFARMFPEETIHIETVNVPSGVSDQPFSSAETLQGAFNRASAAAAALAGGNYWVGIEGGVEETAQSELRAFAWVVVLSADRQGQAQTGIFMLPPRVAELVRDGLELGAADDIVFGRTNSKQENGAVGLLTGNRIDRAAYYEHAVVLALIPFKNPQLYPASGERRQAWNSPS